MIGASDGIEYANMFASFDAGATWNPGTVLQPMIPSYTANGTTIDGTNPNNFSQSFYDQAMLVSPTDPATVYFGGVGLYKAAGSYAHSWTFLAPNGGIHSDQHAMTWDPANNQILVANDGGLYMFDPAQATPTFASLNQNINASQIQGIGPHPTDPTKLIAGFQDNGTQLFSGSVSNWFGPDSETGDGGFEFYDPIDPNFLYHDFSLDEVNHAQISASSDGGQTWCSAPDPINPPCTVFGQQWTPALQTVINGVNDPGPVFYPALAVDPTVAHRVWFGAHSVYVSTDGMAHWAQQTDQDLTADGTIEGSACIAQDCALEDLEFGPIDGQHGRPAWSLAMSDLGGTVAFAVSNTTQADVRLDGTHPHGGFWSDVTGAIETQLKKSSSQGVLATQATSIAPDPHNSSVAYLGLSGFTADTMVGHIYKTVDFGANWTEADGGLPDVPVLKILVDSTDNSGTCGGRSCSNSVFAGTDIGVFHSSDGGTTWQPFNLGVIPAVPVYDMAQNSTGVVFAGTHGRGRIRTRRHCDNTDADAHSDRDPHFIIGGDRYGDADSNHDGNGRWDREPDGDRDRERNHDRRRDSNPDGHADPDRGEGGRFAGDQLRERDAPAMAGGLSAAQHRFSGLPRGKRQEGPDLTGSNCRFRIVGGPAGFAARGSLLFMVGWLR